MCIRIKGERRNSENCEHKTINSSYDTGISTGERITLKWYWVGGQIMAQRQETQSRTQELMNITAWIMAIREEIIPKWQ